MLDTAAAVEAESEHCPGDRHRRRRQRRVATNFRSITGASPPTPRHDLRGWRSGAARQRQLDILTARTPSANGAASLGVPSPTTPRSSKDGTEDEIRPEAGQAVADLRRMGVDVAMITGDARQVAEAVGRDLGIDNVFAEVLPEDKDQAVSALQQRGQSVAMVGDGVNDAPALARSDVGLAIGAGTDVAIESADVVLASSDPRGVASVIRLSRASYRKMIQNPAAGRANRRHPTRRRSVRGAARPVPAVGAALMSPSTIVVAQRPTATSGAAPAAAGRVILPAR